MLVEVVGDLLQAILAGDQFHDLGAGRHSLHQAVGILDPRIDEHHALARHRDGAGGRCGIGLAVGVLAGRRVIGGRCLGGIGCGMTIGLGRGIGHRGGDGAVEQHARFKGHDHGRRWRPLAFGCP
ncbi:hypothetical protein D3C78_1199180 [compost metagenome]